MSPSSQAQLALPGQILVVDLVEGLPKEAYRGKTYDSIFTGADYSSGYLYMAASGKKTEDVLEQIEGPVAEDGYSEVHSDNGPCFLDKFTDGVRKLGKQLGWTITHKQGVNVRPESQSAGEFPHQLSNKFVIQALLGLEPNDTDEVPRNWQERVKPGWIKKLGKIRHKINYVLRVGSSQRCRAFNHKGMAAPNVSNVGTWVCTPAGTVEAVSALRNAEQTAALMRVNQGKLRRSLAKTQATLEARASESQHVPIRSGDFVMKVKESKPKFVARYMSMLYIVRSADPEKNIGVRVERIDGRPHYSLGGINVRLFKRVIMARHTVSAFLAAVGLTKDQQSTRLKQLDGWAHYDVTFPTAIESITAETKLLTLTPPPHTASVAVLNVGGRSLVTRAADAVESEILRRVYREHEVVFLSETKVSPKSLARSLEILALLAPEFTHA